MFNDIMDSVENMNSEELKEVAKIYKLKESSAKYIIKCASEDENIAEYVLQF